jgi:methylmalonyl-CoA mutase cobalamin-binding subunit
VAGDRAAEPPRGAAEADVEDEVASVLVEAAMVHVHALEPRQLEDVLRRGIAVEGTGGFVRRIAVPLLRRIGDEWHGGRLSIAGEHFASSIVEGMLVEAMRTVRPVPGAPRLLVATPAGSHHVIAAAMAGAIAAAEGWDVFFLGGDLPAAEIADAARTRAVNAVALSVLYTDDPERLAADVLALRDRLPRATPLLLGGRAVVRAADALARPGIALGATLDDLRTMLQPYARS